MSIVFDRRNFDIARASRGLRTIRAFASATGLGLSSANAIAGGWIPSEATRGRISSELGVAPGEIWREENPITLRRSAAAAAVENGAAEAAFRRSWIEVGEELLDHERRLARQQRRIHAGHPQHAALVAALATHAQAVARWKSMRTGSTLAATETRRQPRRGSSLGAGAAHAVRDQLAGPDQATRLARDIGLGAEQRRRADPEESATSCMGSIRPRGDE